MKEASVFQLTQLLILLSSNIQEVPEARIQEMEKL